MLRIKELRKSREMTQKQLGDLLGVERSNISTWENGVRQMDYETMFKMADFFEVPLDYLLGRADEMYTVHIKKEYPMDDIEKWLVDTYHAQDGAGKARIAAAVSNAVKGNG